MEPITLELTVLARRVESTGVISLTLADPEHRALPPWTPGSHIDLHFGSFVRQYSLCSNPEDPGHWRVGILREAAGRGASAAIHDTVSEGDVLAVSVPRNNFELVESPRYLFIAGGIGITAILPMVHAADRSGAAWQLVYAGRSVESMAFVDQLAEFGDRVRLVPSDTEGREDFAALLAQPQEDTVIYACGPDGLLDVLAESTAAWPEGSLHVEHFVAQQADTSADVAFEVEFADSGITATIPADRSILSVAEELGLPVVSSCREGTCGTCETPVFAGIPLHRDAILTDAERADNDTMFICVGRSEGGCRLTLGL